MMKQAVVLAGLLGMAASLQGARGAEAPGREIPEAFVPFEHMVGSWKGMAIPSANRLKGWPETHLWAWKFARGNPIGMTIELKGDRTLVKGLLTYAPASKQYRLEGTGPAGEPLVFVGTMDKAGKMLVLEREAGADDGKDRLTIRPNSNLIRYVVDLDHQEKGAPQFKRVIEVGLTKEGESFAAGGSAANLPKCILTGGSATMTVSYQGKSYPICCSGCRDEFNENPEKYAKKAALMAGKDAKAPARTASSRVGKDDGSFDGLLDEKPKEKASPARASKTTAKKAGEPSDDGSAPVKDEAKAAARAASQLRLGQNLEKTGKTAAAIQFYRDVVKDYPGTSEAKTAAARIKALGGK
jgi:YHS domain-containing protein